jgi:hypothetical protein
MNKKEYSFFETHGFDRKGNEISISVKGVDDNELTKFGGLDLHIKTVKYLISDCNKIDFAKKDDYTIEGKVFALYLNEIGELMRSVALDSVMLKSVSNMDLVKHFMNHWHEDKELVAIVEKDNAQIQKEAEEIEREEDEIWNNLMKSLNKEK